MGAKCNLPESEHETVLAQFPACLDAEEEDRIRGLFPQYLFFHMADDFDDSGLDSSSKPVRICHCTNCHETFEAVRGNYMMEIVREIREHDPETADKLCTGVRFILQQTLDRIPAKKEG